MPWKYKDNKKDKENMLLMILTSKKKKSQVAFLWQIFLQLYEHLSHFVAMLYFFLYPGCIISS